MLKNDEILKLINQNLNSTQRQDAEIGQKYYEGVHDIKNYKLYYYNANGELIEDTQRSNIKISHPFFTELVDQAVQYLLSSQYYIKSDLPELQTKLNEYFNENENFTSELYDLLTGTQVKGYEYMFAYIDNNNKLSFKVADSLNVIEVDAKTSSDGNEYVIYHYIDKTTNNGDVIKKIQVWDKNQVYHYTQINNGELTFDANSVDFINPRPHILYRKNNDNNTYYDSLGYIPFFRLDNNKKRISALKPIKEIIDDYDLMSCGLSNNIQDASEYVVVVKGFQGDTMDELIQNVKTKKHIGVESDGDLDFKTVNIPTEARKIKLEQDEKDIYRFGMGFNSTQLGDGYITNVVIKSRYALLDMKCNKLEIKITQFLRKILKIVLDEINKHNKTAYQLKDVYFNFKREVMANSADNAQIELVKAQKRQVDINTMLSLQSVIGEETALQNICEILDISYQDVVDKVPKDLTYGDL